MKKTDLAWAAGLIDGEGCICIVKENRPGNLSTQYRLRLSVGMTDKKTIKKLHSLLN